MVPEMPKEMVDRIVVELDKIREDSLLQSEKHLRELELITSGKTALGKLFQL